MIGYYGSHPSQESMGGSETTLPQRLRVLQIIRAAVIAGPLAFLPIAFICSNAPLTFQIGLFEIIAIVMLATTILIFLMISKLNPPRNIETLRAASPIERENHLVASIFSNEIIKGAMLEAPTFFSFILIMIDGSLVGLTIGLLLTIVAIAVFPTGNRFRNQVEAMKFKYGL